MFVEIDKLILNFIWKYKGSRTAKTILRERNKAEDTARYQDLAKTFVSIQGGIDARIDKSMARQKFQKQTHTYTGASCMTKITLQWSKGKESFLQ